MHPTDTEHKWPRDTDGEHVTPEAIVVQLSTNLSLYYKSHVYSLTSVNSVCNKALSREKALQRTDSFIDCPFRSDMPAPFELIVFSLGGNHQKKFCMPTPPSPPTNVHLGANIKRTLLEAMKNERQTKFSPLILLS